MKFAIILLAACFIGLAKGQAWVPASRPDGWWWDRHNGYVQNTNINYQNIKVLFYGDSITEGWGNNAIWQEYYAPLGAANYGIGGDQTQHLIFRMLNGELSNLNPKIVVLKIGTNNLGGHSDDDIVRGVTTIIDTLYSYMSSDTTVLLLGVLPRSGAGLWDRIININSKLAEAYLTDADVVFFDMWDAFTATSPEYGTIDPSIFPDGVHLSAAGYQLWAETMDGVFNEIWESKAKGRNLREALKVQ